MDIQPFLVSRLKSRISQASKRSGEDRNAALEERVAALEYVLAGRRLGEQVNSAYCEASKYVADRWVKMKTQSIAERLGRSEAVTTAQGSKELAERRRIYLTNTASTDDMLTEIGESYE